MADNNQENKAQKEEGTEGTDPLSVEQEESAPEPESSKSDEGEEVQPTNRYRTRSQTANATDGPESTKPSDAPATQDEASKAEQPNDKAEAQGAETAEISKEEAKAEAEISKEEAEAEAEMSKEEAVAEAEATNEDIKEEETSKKKKGGGCFPCCGKEED